MDRHAPTRHPVLATLALLAAATAAPAAGATDLLGFSIGAGLGQSSVKVDRVNDIDPLDFNEHGTGWKGYVAVRPIRFFGVEVEYVDFGHPSTRLNAVSTDSKVRGPAAFGVLYLPLPLVDLYAKAGVARLQTTATGTPIQAPPPDMCFVPPPGPGCPFRLDRNDTRGAIGLGVQFKLSSLTLRAEFEQFSTGVGDPNLASLSLGWRF
jgi:hypothetical protein